MKKYKFIIRKILKNEVEIKAENRNEAFKNILELLSTNEEYLFKNLDKNNQIYEIKIDKILNNLSNKEETIKQISKEKEQNIDRIINKIIEQIKEDIVESYIEDCSENKNKTDIENDSGIEDDLPKEYDEIVCEKCGHCILLDKDLLS